jgi:hypothetical protein
MRASTRTTALSQHCPCGARVDKRLADRVHRCTTCGLVGDRDAVAAVLASFVVLVQRDEPSSARVDYDAASHALPAIQQALSPYQGWQDTLSESTDLSARDGSFITWRRPHPTRVGWLGEPSARHRAPPGMSLAQSRPRPTELACEPTCSANITHRGIICGTPLSLGSAARRCSRSCRAGRLCGARSRRP